MEGQWLTGRGDWREAPGEEGSKTRCGPENRRASWPTRKSQERGEGAEKALDLGGKPSLGPTIPGLMGWPKTVREKGGGGKGGPRLGRPEFSKGKALEERQGRFQGMAQAWGLLSQRSPSEPLRSKQQGAPPGLHAVRPAPPSTDE